jgi:signal transduction histidine kinase
VNREASRKIGLRSMVVVPLYHNGGAVGVLKVLSSRPRAFSERDAWALQLMAGLIGAAMSNAAEFESRQALLAERTSTVAALETRARQQNAIAQLSQRASAGRDLAALLEDAVELVPQILEVEYCSVSNCFWTATRCFCVHFLQSVANVLAAVIHRRQLEEELLAISGREQRRIGQDLHDGLCQQLVGIEFRNSVLVQQLAKEEEAKTEAIRIGELIRDVTRQARLLAKGLSPVRLDAAGLMSALQELTSNSSKLFNISCGFECPQPLLVGDNTVASHLYRIVHAHRANIKAKLVIKTTSVLISYAARWIEHRLNRK